jgi:hypothetical protein
MHHKWLVGGPVINEEITTYAPNTDHLCASTNAITKCLGEGGKVSRDPF